MKIEAGKSYRTDDGRNTGPLSAYGRDYFIAPNIYQYRDTKSRQLYEHHGGVCHRSVGEEKHHIVAEWSDAIGFEAGKTYRHDAYGVVDALFVGNDTDRAYVRFRNTGEEGGIIDRKLWREYYEVAAQHPVYLTGNKILIGEVGGAPSALIGKIKLTYSEGFDLQVEIVK